MSNLALAAAASGLAVALAGCGPNTPPARAALDCPARQGELTRTAAAADGKACTYATVSGAEIKLQLVSTAAAGPDAALSAIETALLADRAPPSANAITQAGKPDAASDNTSAHRAAQAAVDEARSDTKGVHVRVDIQGDGHSHGDPDHSGTTRVNLPGIHIIANERDETANVKVGPLTVKAGEDSVDLRMRRDVRLRGEAFNPQKRGMRATFIYTGKDLPDGLRFVGYEAAGPKSGPITVATVRSKLDESEADGDGVYGDVKRLVRRNGGV